LNSRFILDGNMKISVTVKFELHHEGLIMKSNKF